MRLLPFGVDGVLVELDDLAAVLAGRDALHTADIAGVTELIPGARTILVRFDPAVFAREHLEHALNSASASVSVGPSGDLVTIDVVYDGEDLAEVATLTGLTVDEVIARHTAPTYGVAFTGFAPGFAYLSGGDPALIVPRRSTPRMSIPAGSVGLAGEFSGVYPRQSPGGWQLLGRTALLLWDPARSDRPALLRPGDRVQFVRRREALELPAVPAPAEAGAVPPKALRIERVTLSSTVQDHGRAGASALGLSRSGAMDASALTRANGLVGNPASAAAIEFTAGLVVQAVGHVVIGLAGSIGPVVRIDNDDERDILSADAPFDLRHGERVEIATGSTGVYGYLAVLGGITAQQLLGSASTNILTGIGRAPLATGDLLEVGNIHDGAVENWPELAAPLPSPGDLLELPVVLGPRDDWFSSESVNLFLQQEWTVSSQSNRVGIRLTGGQPLQRTTDRELPSEGMQPGAVQVPPDGQPVVFGKDHPVTGGYPVIAALTPRSLEQLAQVPAGGRVRFIARNTA